MGGKTSRTKGLSYEREIAQAFRPIFPEAIRQLEYQEGLGIDLANTGRLRIQCKRGKKYAPLSKIKEAEDGDGIPCLVTRADRDRSIVALYLEDFLALLQNPGFELGTEVTSHGIQEVRKDREEGSPQNHHCEERNRAKGREEFG